MGGSGDRESKGKMLRGIRKRRREEGEKEFRDETESVLEVRLTQGAVKRGLSARSGESWHGDISLVTIVMIIMIILVTMTTIMTIMAMISIYANDDEKVGRWILSTKNGGSCQSDTILMTMLTKMKTTGG